VWLKKKREREREERKEKSTHTHTHTHPIIRSSTHMQATNNSNDTDMAGQRATKAISVTLTIHYTNTLKHKFAKLIIVMSHSFSSIKQIILKNI